MIQKLLPVVVLTLLTLVSITGHAEEPYKGFKKTETEHFIFIFEERDRAAVEELVTFCEDVYDQLTGYFNSYPQKIPVVIYGRFDTANGYFTSYPSHISLYLTSPSTPWIGSKHKNWLKLLFIHEFTHYVHITSEYGFLYALSLVFGSSIRVQDFLFLPGWMVEGITVTMETLLTEGGRGRNPFFEIYYKAPILDHSLFSLQQASYSSHYPPDGRIYVAGYLMVHYMMEQFGKDVFERITRLFATFPFIGPRLAIRRVTGKSALDIYYGMKRDLQEQFLDDRDIPSGTQLTPEVIGDYYFPEITEKGLYFYRNSLEKRPALVRWEPETGEETVLFETPLTDYTSFSAPRDGSKIVFATGTYDKLHPAGPTYTSDLYVLDPETSDPNPITQNSHLWHPELSREGTMLVAVQGVGSYSRLVVVDQDNGTVTPLFFEEGATVFNPRFSPDGTKLCFSLHVRGTQDIWVLDLSRLRVPPGEMERALDTSSQAVYPVTGLDRSGDFFPRFLDNTTLTFSSAREGSLALYAVSLEDGSCTKIGEDPVGVFEGTVYRGELLYASYTARGFAVKTRPIEKHSVDFSIQKEARELPELPSGGTLGTVKPYIDVPKPLYWIPLPYFLNPISSQPLTWGIGAFVYGNSVLGKASWQTQITMNPILLQPGIDFSTSIDIGITTLSYTLAQAYLPVSKSEAYQVTQHSLGLTLPFINRTRFSTNYYCALFGGMSHQFRLKGDRPFPFAGLGSPVNLTKENRFSVDGALRFSITRSGSPRDFHTPAQVTTDFSASVPLPVADMETTGVDASGTVSFSVPSPIPHQVLKLGAKSRYVSPGLLNNYDYTNTITPRGSYEVTEKEKEGRLLASLDYLFSIALLDAALPLGYNMFGFNIQGIGGGVHVEMLGDWQLSKPCFSLDDYIYVGLELNVEFGTNFGSFPLGSGITFRFDRQFKQPVEPLKDLGFYLFFGKDSFNTQMDHFR